LPRHSQSSKTRRPAAWPWALTWVLGMGGLVTLSAWRQVPLIEQHLLGEVQRAVLPIVSAPTTVSVDGHEATITGSVADAAEHEALLAAVAGVAGIRTVVDRLVTREEVVPDTAPDSLPDIAPDTAPDSLPDIAPDTAPDSLPDIAPDTSPRIDVPTLATLLPTDDAVGNGTAAPADGPAVAPFAGTRADTPPIDASPAGPLELASVEMPSAPVPSIEPVEPVEPALPAVSAPAATDVPLPSLSLAVVDQALTLQGRIGAGQDLNELVQPALAAFDPSYLTNQIDTTVSTAVADWIEPVAGLLPQLAELKDASLDIVDRQVTLGGTAPSRDSRDRLVDLALASFERYEVVERVSVDASVPDSMIDTVAPPPPGTTPLPAAVREIRPTPGPLRRALEALDSERLAFESSSDVLTATSDERLDALADLLAAHPAVVVEIEGHTDATGSAEFNLSLSQKRASAVKRALIERGIRADRLVAYGYGEGVPVADNSTAEGRARNRRIEFRF